MLSRGMHASCRASAVRFVNCSRLSTEGMMHILVLLMPFSLL